MKHNRNQVCEKQVFWQNKAKKNRRVLTKVLTSESKRISKQEREATKNSLNLYRELSEAKTGKKETMEKSIQKFV